MRLGPRRSRDPRTTLSIGAGGKDAVIGHSDSAGRIDRQQEVLGRFELQVVPRFGGMPAEQADASLELFAREVLPVAKKFD